MNGGNQLGDYLRARRELITPADVDLPVTGVRRVAGLRREEVATLAGISSDYYLRLEQGRDRNPSVAVLEALARVLRLDAAATAYLIDLAAPKARSVRRRARRESLAPTMRGLLGAMNLPAFVEDRYLDVLGSNALARALSPNLAEGGNRMLDHFLDPAERTLYLDWDAAAAGLVAGFRNSVGTDVDDPRFARLVGELSIASEPFRRLWARHDVKARDGVPARLRHPQVGEMTLIREKLDVSGTDGQTMVLYHAAPGTTDGDKLALLGSLVVDEQVERTRSDRY